MTYLGYEIFTKDPLIEAQSSSINNEYILIGKDYKKQSKYVYQPTQRGFVWNFFLKDSADKANLRNFFISHFGRYRAFWLPSFKNDFEIIFQTTQNSFTCKKAFRAEGFFNQKRHIYIPDFSFASKIDVITTNDETETVTLLNNLPNIIGSNVMNLFLVRFDSDDFKIEAIGRKAFKVNLSFKEVQGETP
ncbi:MAG: hypothetical protein ACK5LP_00985 [Campylobacteraceae bacterium]